jgi:hypothetical protein
MGVRVELERDPCLCCLLEQRVHVDGIRLAREKQAPSGVAENREPRIVHGSENASGHLAFGHPEARVHRADDVVEAIQRVIVVVELARRQNVGFDSLEDREVGQRRVERVDLVVLTRDIVRPKAARVERGL